MITEKNNPEHKDFAARPIATSKIANAMLGLMAEGIDAEQARVALQAIGYSLFNTEVFPDDFNYDELDAMIEKLKPEILGDEDDSPNEAQASQKWIQSWYSWGDQNPPKLVPAGENAWISALVLAADHIGNESEAHPGSEVSVKTDEEAGQITLRYSHDNECLHILITDTKEYKPFPQKWLHCWYSWGEQEEPIAIPVGADPWEFAMNDATRHAAEECKEYPHYPVELTFFNSENRINLRYTRDGEYLYYLISDDKNFEPDYEHDESDEEFAESDKHITEIGESDAKNRITKEMIEVALRAEIITVTMDKLDERSTGTTWMMTAHIGNETFRFGDIKDEYMDPMTVPFDIIVDELYRALDECRSLEEYTSYSSHYQYLRENLPEDPIISSRERIDKTMIEAGLRANIIIPKLEENGLTAHIGDRWFWFGKTDFDFTDPNTIPFEDLVEQIKRALDGFYEDPELRNNYLYFYQTLRENLPEKPIVSSRERIDKTMIEVGLKAKLIIPKFEESGLAAHIGEYWFYFGGTEFEFTDPKDIPFDVLVEEIMCVLDSFYENPETHDEYLYYYHYLCENI